MSRYSDETCTTCGGSLDTRYQHICYQMDSVRAHGASGTDHGEDSQDVVFYSPPPSPAGARQESVSIDIDRDEGDEAYSSQESRHGAEVHADPTRFAIADLVRAGWSRINFDNPRTRRSFRRAVSYTVACAASAVSGAGVTLLAEYTADAGSWTSSVCREVLRIAQQQAEPVAGSDAESVSSASSNNAWPNSFPDPK